MTIARSKIIAVMRLYCELRMKPWKVVRERIELPQFLRNFEPGRTPQKKRAEARFQQQVEIVHAWFSSADF